MANNLPASILPYLILGSTTPNVVNGTNGNFSGTVAVTAGAGTMHVHVECVWDNSTYHW